MNERQVDLAHAVALGPIDDEDHLQVQELLDTEDPVLRTIFLEDIRQTKAALSALSATSAVTPPTSLRTRILEAVAAEEPPVAS
ncbi:hypothetical protein [Nocardia callitridis]|uniref:Anti-sigma factor n=1 Tax=Nocardia callitridis TaxID=648753 RepID=A0ABP9KXD2_9NOCA